MVGLIILIIILGIILIIVGVKATEPTAEELLGISKIEEERIEEELKKELDRLERRENYGK